MAKVSYLVLLVVLAIFTGKALSAPPNSKEDANNEYDDYVGDSEDGYDEDEEEEEIYTGPPPVIHTVPITLELRPGATALLPCNISNSDPNLVVMWKKGATVLFSDNIKLTFDKRLERQEDLSLEIRNVNAQDSGEYFCELSTADAMHIKHTVHVFEEPSIKAVRPAPHHIVQKGSPLTLECEVSGYPVPTITWTRKGKRLPSGEESVVGTAITFESVTRRHNGTYECVADNGRGKPAHATIDVHVHYAPEVEIEKEIFNTAEGYESELVCTVHAEPKAKVWWYKEGNHVGHSERITEAKEGSRHILRIGRTQRADFGTYTCFANNTIGRNQKAMKLSGLPSKAQFVGESSKLQSHVLRWKVESNSPITEYKLLYRKKDSSEWKTENPEVLNPDGNVYQVEAEIHDLGAGSYEVTLLSKNAYGWSERSEMHSFSVEYQKTEPQANSVVKEEATAEESTGSGVDQLRPTVLAVLLVYGMKYFLV